MISVRKVDNQTFQVKVQGKTITEHTVTVRPGDYQKITGGKISPEELVRKSFQFLLERESNTSILRSFDLSVISTYFPEYQKTIQEMLD